VPGNAELVLSGFEARQHPEDLVQCLLGFRARY